MRRLTHALSYLVALLIGCAVSMGLSFVIVRHLAMTQLTPTKAGPVHTEEAERLRQLSNELIRLTNDYLNRASGADVEPGDEFSTWLSRNFRPRINDLRRRMTESSPSLPALSGLIGAADKVASAASHPENRAWRRDAMDAVLKATGAAEAAISSLLSGTPLPEPGLLPKFR